jgi:hypothetical protein
MWPEAWWKAPFADPNATECVYNESIGFSVGDTALVIDPGSTIHNSMHEVVCPEGEGLVALNEQGSFLPDQLRLLSVWEVVLIAARNRAVDIGIAAQGQFGKVKDKFNEHKPAVQETILQYGAITREKTAEISQRALVAVNVCDPEVRAEAREQVMAGFAAIESRTQALADVAAERMPAQREKMSKMWAATASKIAAFGAKWEESATSIAEKEEVRDLMSNLSSRFKEMQVAVVGRVNGLKDKASGAIADNENITKAIVAFQDRFDELSIIVRNQTDVKREQAQAVLATIQSGTGKLLSEAASRSEPVKKAIGDFTAASATQIAEYSRMAFDAVNLCNPEKRQQLGAAFAVVQYRVGELATAVKERWPGVKENVAEIAMSLGAKITTLKIYTDAYIKNVTQREDVQAVLAGTSQKYAELREALASQTATIGAKAVVLSVALKEQINELISKSTGEDASSITDEEGISEFGGGLDS